MRAPALLNKPEYLCRPTQILSKIRFLIRSQRSDHLLPVSLPWGDVIRASATDAIGKSLLTLGVHELAVSEVLWRLVDRGDVCLDIGANIGYMTSLLSIRTGRAGRVFSFEPHPRLFACLKRNLESFSNGSRIVAEENAIGAADGMAELAEPVGFEKNAGTASVLPSVVGSDFAGVKQKVAMRRLDSIFLNDESFGVVKIDVEGAELDVFRGAKRLLTTKRIRDVVWEDHNVFPSESAKLLLKNGYKIYQFSKKIFGLAIWDPFRSQAKRADAPWETVNFLATYEPARAVTRLSPRGWQCLQCA